jgi:hypothetical protein
MDTDTLEFQLSEADEHIVRSYECTRLKPLFAPEAIGRLTITNKRIVYHSHGGSLSGKSVLVSEMPVEDAAGVSVYMGTSLNWLLYIALAVGLYVASSIVDALLPAFFTHWALGLVLMLPYAVVWIFSSKWLSDDVKQRAKGSVDNLLASTGRSISPNRWQPIIRVLFYVGVVIFAWALTHSRALRYGLPFIGLLLLLVAYFAIFMALFGRRKVFTLVVGSRSMQGSGIYIPGTSFRLGGNRTAADTLAGAPAADADKLARELGALLSDLRQYGESAAQKWQA